LVKTGARAILPLTRKKRGKRAHAEKGDITARGKMGSVEKWGQWKNGVMEKWGHGKMGSWKNGVMEKWGQNDFPRQPWTPPVPWTYRRSIVALHRVEGRSRLRHIDRKMGHDSSLIPGRRSPRQAGANETLFPREIQRQNACIPPASGGFLRKSRKGPTIPGAAGQ
jgi:hypothetical protein